MARKPQWYCLKCGFEWIREPTWSYLPSWTPGIHGVQCKGAIVRRPTAVQGSAGVAKTQKPSAIAGLMQTSDSQYNVQGSGAKPYIVDLEGHDDDISGTTHTCTCVNWKITRNSMKASDGTFNGYDCKHIRQVLDAKGVPKTTGVTAKRAQELKSEIMDTFVKKGN